MSLRRSENARATGHDLRDVEASPAAAHAAIRDGTDITVRVPPRTTGEGSVPVPPDRPAAYDVLGPVGDAGETSRRLLAAAARTRGLTTPHDGEIRRLEERLDSLDVPEADTAAAKRQVADASQDEAALRERIAELRGRLRTERELGKPTGETADELAAAAAKLSEASTDRIAAEQALESAEREARSVRNARNRRLKLQDRLENRRREARAFLADALAGEFEAAVDRVEPLGGEESSGASDAGTQLAAVAVAELEVPIVVDARRTGIDDAGMAAELLDIDVWLCEP
ncbi:MAG: hypothetical protein V5A46_00600 [Haloferacaceae archaeon]